MLFLLFQRESEEKSKTITKLCGEVQSLNKILVTQQSLKGKRKDRMKKVGSLTDLCPRSALTSTPPPPIPDRTYHTPEHQPVSDTSELTSQSALALYRDKESLSDGERELPNSTGNTLERSTKETAEP